MDVPTLFEVTPAFFGIFDPARGQIYGKTAGKIVKNEGKLAFLRAVFPKHNFSLLEHVCGQAGTLDPCWTES